jgi:nitronate monooxygenase
VLELERNGATFDDIRHLVAGQRGKEGLAVGDLDHGLWGASIAQGLIHDVPTVAELIERIIKQAEEILSERLSGFLTKKPASTPATIVPWQTAKLSPC